MTKRIVLSFILYFISLALAIWVIGFGFFCLYAVSFKFHSIEKADAIVVLTGGGERVSTALDLLSQKYAERLFISGVNESVKLSDLTPQISPELKAQITLGYQAKDTRGNAKETAEFIHNHNIKTILLITSFYHMPRSVFEVLKETAHTKIIPLPVFPKSFNDSVDWIKTRYAWLLFIEYHKFIATKLQYFIERVYQ